MKRSTIWLLGLLTFVCCGLRVYQLCALTEPGSEFLSRFDWSSSVLCILLPLGLAALLAESQINRRLSDAPLENANLAGIGVSSLLLALSLLLDAVIDLVKLSLGTSGHDPFLSVWWIIVDGLGLVTAIFFILQTAKCFRGNTLRINPLFALLPAVWLAIRALITYLDARVVVTVPAKLLEVTTMVCVAVFFVVSARLLGDVDSRKGQRMALSLVPVSILMIGVTVLPAVVGFFCRGAAVSPVSFTTVTLAMMMPYVWQIGECAGRRAPEGDAD